MSQYVTQGSIASVPIHVYILIHLAFEAEISFGFKYDINV